MTSPVQRTRQHAICPDCGRDMAIRSKLCRSCAAIKRQQDGRYAANSHGAMMDRHHRFQRALGLGCGIYTLMCLAQQGAIPSHNELDKLEDAIDGQKAQASF